MPTTADFKLNSEVLFNRIEDIKKNPPPQILAYKAEHPEFKTVNCALLAEYIGLSEKTLTNLKLGKLTDSNCSTIWMLCTALGIDPRDYLGLPKRSECNPDACSGHAQVRLEEKRQRISELETSLADKEKELSRLRVIIREQSEECGAAKAHSNALERLISEKEASIARRDAGIRMRNRIILCAMLFFSLTLVADLLLGNFGWFRFGPIK